MFFKKRHNTEIVSVEVTCALRGSVPKQNHFYVKYEEAGFFDLIGYWL